MVPTAFLALLASELFNTRNVEWERLALADLRQAQEDEIPAIIVCRPRMFWNSEWGRIDEGKLTDAALTPFAAYRHDYVYWDFQKSYSERTPEDKWVLDNGGYKEPLLILVSATGEIRSIKGLSFDSLNHTKEIVDFLGLTRRHRVNLSICLVATSVIASIAIIVFRRKQNPNGG